MELPKKYLLILIFLLNTLAPLQLFAQHKGDDIIGIWETPGDDSGLIEIFKTENKYFGKIIQLKYPSENGKPRTDRNNPDKNLRNRPIPGIQIIKDFVFDGKDMWEDGEIYDPKSGNTYSCQISFEDKNTIKVRGYIGFSLIGRTEYWTKKK